MKVGVVGTGMVGATAAYAMVMQGVGREIVLVDLNKERTQAEADDLYHAVPFAHQMKVVAGDYPQLADCKVVIVAAGVGQKPGETRLELLKRNAAVFSKVIPEILQYAPDAILVIATNPVDIMTHVAARYAADLGIDSHRVLGSGTTLDTARFRALLARHVGVDPHHVHAYVIGEHGDSEVLAWSTATVGGLPLMEWCEYRRITLDDTVRTQIDHGVRNAAYNIIKGKGATYYGIGSALARITDAILRDERAILTVCTPQANIAGVEHVTVAMPYLLGGGGIIGDHHPIVLEADEQEKLQRSAHIIRDMITKMEAGE